MVLLLWYSTPMSPKQIKALDALFIAIFAGAVTAGLLYFPAKWSYEELAIVRDWALGRGEFEFPWFYVFFVFVVILIALNEARREGVWPFRSPSSQERRRKADLEARLPRPPSSSHEPPRDP